MLPPLARWVKRSQAVFFIWNHPANLPLWGWCFQTPLIFTAPAFPPNAAQDAALDCVRLLSNRSSPGPTTKKRGFPGKHGLFCGGFLEVKLNEHQQQLVFQVDFLKRHKRHHGNNKGKPQQHDRVWLSQIGCQEVSSEKVFWHLLQTFLDFQRKFALFTLNWWEPRFPMLRKWRFSVSLKIFHLWDDRYRKSLCNSCFTPQDISLFHTYVCIYNTYSALPKHCDSGEWRK